MANKFLKQSKITQDGEVVSTIVKELYNPFRDGYGYNLKYQSTYVKSYLEISLPDELNDTEIGKLTRLSRYIYSDSNLLAKRTHGIVIPITKDEIRAIVGLSKPRCSQFLSKAKKLKIIKFITLDKKEYCCFSPIYFNSTTYMGPYLYLAFQTELDEILPDWVIEKYLDMIGTGVEKQPTESMNSTS